MENDRIATQILNAALGDEPVAKLNSNKQQEPGSADHWTQAVLLERGAYLRQLANAGNGEASEVVRDYPQHRVILSFRSRNGEVEVHQKFADLFLVISGAATLVTGGTVVGGRQIGPGETRGDAIEDGHAQELRQGELIHVPAGTPHQFLVSADKTVTCVVLKIQESQ